MARTSRVDNYTMASVLPLILIQPKKGWQIVDWREVCDYRDLLFFMVLRDITVVYKQTVLGFAWALLNPFLNMVVFTVIFGTMAKVPTDGIPKPIIQNGYIPVPDAPGLGFKINDDAIQEHLIPEDRGFFEPTPQWDTERSWDRLWS